MEGIVFQNIDRDKFIDLYNKVDELNTNVKRLVDNKFQENVTPEESARIKKCSIQTIYADIKEGKLKASKSGRKLLIKRSDLEDSLKEVKSLKYKR